MSADRTKLDYVAPAGMGLKVGPNSEFTLVFKIKAGHGKMTRDDLKQFEQAVRTSDAPFLAGLHDSRIALFDNDTRLLFCTTFDGGIDKYVDDAVLRLMGVLHPWLRHLEGYTGTMDAPAADLDKAKEWFLTHFCTSSVYTRVYPRALKEILKALRVNEAFQKVLDNPAAHKVLQDPALKPLLELASD